MKAASDAGDPRLLAKMVEEIRSAGPIPFSRFMELSLYDPDHGYYARASRIGKDGDFFTATDVGTLFGSCLARQIVEMDRILEHPAQFRIAEHGAGRGLLARDILDALKSKSPSLSARVRPVLVDVSSGMRAESAAAVPEAVVVHPDQLDVAGDGCAIAVELFDALPVRRVRRRGGKLLEVFVDADGDGVLFEREGVPDAVTLDWATGLGAAPEEGDEAEISPALVTEFDRVERGVRRGFVVIVDYGYRNEELRARTHRRGTLLAYHRHRTSEEYLLRVGEQDLTAHVNFSVVEARARELGLDVLGLTTQDRFLIASGAIDEVEEGVKSWPRYSPDHRGFVPASSRGARPRLDPLTTVRRRLQMKQLIHPEGMGRRFKVLVLSKGITPRPSLTGLADPFARHP